jgi:hypothetical protein
MEETEIKRGPGRPKMRAETPREDALESVRRAQERAKALASHFDNIGSGEEYNKFDLRGVTVPEGWSYEWKRHTVMGAEDPSYQVELANGGWEPVPTSRHPSLMPVNTREPVIIREGMMLMERPQQITDMFRAKEKRDAKALVKQKEEALGMSPIGQFERGPVTVKKSIEAIPVPEDDI